jgi:hypothetical protein
MTAAAAAVGSVIVPVVAFVTVILTVAVSGLAG